MYNGNDRGKTVTFVETINNFPIIETAPLKGGCGTRDGRIIMVFRGKNTFQPFVVARQFRGKYSGDNGDWDKSWDQGNYYESIEQANATFKEMVREDR